MELPWIDASFVRGHSCLRLTTRHATPGRNSGQIIRGPSRAMMRWRWKVLTSLMFLFLNSAPTAYAQSLSPARMRGTSPVRKVTTRKIRSSVPAASSGAVNVTGTWTDSYAFIWTLTQSASPISGTVDVGVGTCPNNLWSVHGTATSGGFFLTATNPTGGDDECVSAFTYVMTLVSSGSASGTWTNTGGGSGSVTMTLTGTISLSRQSLTVVHATGTPSGGTFAYTTTPLSGSNLTSIDFADGVSNTTNPNIADLSDPKGNGAPTPGGLASITAQYTAGGTTVSDTFQVPTFGMSCYMIALESDYGTPPSSCASTRLYGQTISNSLTNPNGLTGTYCASFIANVKLQGSAQLNGGQYIQYSVKTGMIVPVSAIDGSDGTAVVAGQTVARDYAIIPAKGILVDVDEVGTGLLANDSGGAIKGYRLDLFNGAGKAVCAGYTNPIGVGACETAQPLCPVSALQ